MASDFGHPGAQGPRVRMQAQKGEPTGAPFGAPNPEVRATTGESTGLKIPVSAPTQRGASSSARRPGCTGNRTLREPERIAPCRLRSLRETLTRRGGRGATAYPPRGGLATQRRLSDCKHWGVGAPGGTRTPAIRLRSPSAFSVFSVSCGIEGTLEDTNRLEGSAPPTAPYLLRLGGRDRKTGEAGLSARIASPRWAVLDLLLSPCAQGATSADR